jgi:predicted ArsR family transcriptional regulator
MRTSLFEDYKVVDSIIALLLKTSMPVSVDFVAKNLGLSWSTARAILMQLCLEGRLKATKTTKSWIFSINKKRV